MPPIAFPTAEIASIVSFLVGAMAGIALCLGVSR